MTSIGFWLQIVSAALALVAAGLWIRSARIKMPDRITWLAVDGGGLPGLNIALGGGRGMPVFSNGFDELVASLKTQSRWSAWAAYAAAAAAVIQGVADVIPSL